MIAMYEVLREAGFTPNEQLISDDPGGVSLQLGRGFQLDAIHCLSDRTFETGVLLSSVYSDAHTLKDIEFWLPVLVESREAGLAHLAYHFDRAMGKAFVPATPQWWLELGRQHRLLLPIVRKLAELEARPICSVDPRWLGIFLQELRKRLVYVTPDDSVRIWFDGHTVFLDLGEQRIPAPAAGRPWSNQYQIAVSDLRQNLPPRRRPNNNWFEIRDDSLYLGHHRLGDAAIIHGGQT